LLQDGHAERLIVGDDAKWGAPPVPLEAINEKDQVLNYETLLAHAPASMFPQLSHDDIAVLQYTGGTTGTPKGAMLTHGNLSAAVSIYGVWQTGQGVQPAQDRVICVLPLFHIYALTSVMLRSIKSGNELMLRPRFDAEATLRDIEVNRATAFPGVPTMWIALNAVPGIEKRDLSSLKHCYSGGAPMPVEVQQRFERLTGHTIRGGWGMTESSPAGTNLPYYASFPLGTIGLPLPGIVIDVVALDDPRRVLGFGEVGKCASRVPMSSKAIGIGPKRQRRPLSKVSS
jgi:long-chain acyl-CoA synthetase